ncbi:hypothetical protein [Serratia fonticola]|uniref:hypothetical protein n=1 Tax=Serratia fonticola TaxID=47917 RepID=UPI003BB62C8A
MDLPGVGETPEYDAEYLVLYRYLLAGLDLIIWVLRADERARTVDITTYRALLARGADPSRFLFVLSQVDRIPPLMNGMKHRPFLLQHSCCRWRWSAHSLPIS